LISLDKALETILEASSPLGVERVDLENASGRILAKPIKAKITQPPFNASAMDGYAVRAQDVAPGTSLVQVGDSQAGAGFEGKIGAGECTRIFTGAPVPKGADAVVMQEQTESDGNSITFEKAALEGQSIRSRGNDFARGDVLLIPGNALSPAAIALAAASNNPKLSVFRRPKIALLGTGDELVAPGSKVAPNKIVASNSYGLSALFAPHTAACIDHGIASDDKAELEKHLAQLLDSDADVVVTTGGASVGDHDYVQEVLKSLGVEIDFWKIAMRPGKPLMFGHKGKTLVFGLPGNPVSAMVTATVAVLPALRALSGSLEPLGDRFRLPLSAPLAANGPRRHFVRSIISAKQDGISAVRPIVETDSAHLSSLAKSNALIVHYEDAPEQPVGQIVDVIPL